MASHVVRLLVCKICKNYIVRCHHEQIGGKYNVRKTKTQTKENYTARMRRTFL
jgi:hypothetical protein